MTQRSLEIIQTITGTDFLRKCIKTCINNVTPKKRETLLNQRFSLF